MSSSDKDKLLQQFLWSPGVLWHT